MLRRGHRSRSAERSGKMGDRMRHVERNLEIEAIYVSHAPINPVVKEEVSGKMIQQMSIDELMRLEYELDSW